MSLFDFVFHALDMGNSFIFQMWAQIFSLKHIIFDNHYLFLLNITDIFPQLISVSLAWPYTL